MRYLLIAFLLLAVIQSRSQNCNLIITGHVEDTDTKEMLFGATVLLIELNVQIVTNEKGNFLFKGICPGSYTIQVSHVGCETVQRKFLLTKRKHLDIFLPHEKNALEEVTVSVQKGVATTGFRQELAGRELDETSGYSLSEALSRINGVTLLQTGSNISKPILHGLHSNRILTINNGVRQEGQQWGNEHAPEIDPFIADKLVVIKGVEELKYGSDAIGGVILVDPKPLRHKPGYYGELNSAYFSNNRQYVLSGSFEQQFKKIPAFSYRLQGTLKRGANMTTPGYRLNNTGIREQNFSVTTGWKKEHYNIEAFYSQFHTRVGIFSGSHIGNLTDLQNAIEAGKPDDIFLGEKTYSISRPYQDVSHRLFKLKSDFSKGESRFHVLVAAQYNHRREYDITRSANTTRPQLDLSILTISEDLSWDHPEFNNLRGTVGLSFMQQDNAYGGRYFIPNYNAASFGGYWLEKWVKHKWELQAGIRYDRKTIATRRLLYNGAEIDHDFNFSTLASSFNTLFRASQQIRINAGITLANRAPHVNELLSNGIHHGTATYEEGDVNLAPEKSVNLALGLTLSNKEKTLSGNISLYNNYINDFIYQQPVPDEPVLTIAGAFPKLQYRQTNARLSGADLAINVQFAQHFDLLSKASILRAYNRSIDDWLIRMPSDRLSNELTYNFNDNIGRFRNSYISLEIANIFTQTRVPSEKNGKQDYKQAPAGYTLLNLNASTVFNLGKTPVIIGIGARNLLNTRYREYLNSFRYFTDEMGRNLSIRIKVPFEKII